MITRDVHSALISGWKFVQAKIYIYKHTWVRMVKEIVSDSALLDYVMLPK